MTWGRSATTSSAPGPIKPRRRAHSFFLPSRARRFNGVAADDIVTIMSTETSSSTASTSYSKRDDTDDFTCCGLADTTNVDPPRLRRPTEAPALPQASPLRARRHKLPLTIAAPSHAAFSSDAVSESPVPDASTPVLSPSTPMSGTLRARRSKASLRIFTTTSPPPCPPPTTPLPQIPTMPAAKSTAESDAHRSQDGLESQSSFASLVGDESIIASNGNHASLSKPATPVVGSGRSSASSLSSGVAAVDEAGAGIAMSAHRKSAIMAEPLMKTGTFDSYAVDDVATAIRGKEDAHDMYVFGFAF